MPWMDDQYVEAIENSHDSLVVLFDYNIETGFNIHRYELIWRIWE
jgi:hypothetical protein